MKDESPKSRRSREELSSSGFRRVRPSSGKSRWSLPAACSILFALAGSALLVRALHHPEISSVPAAPLLAIALLFGAWNRARQRL